MEPFDELGTFWIPERPESARTGRLTFEHGSMGLRLVVLNPFEDSITFMSQVNTHPGYGVVFGQLESGDAVTLTNARIGSTNMRIGGALTARIELLPSYVFRGAHLSDGEDTAFTSLELRFEHLDAWAIPGRIPTTQTGDHVQVDTAPPPSCEGSAFEGRVSVDYHTSEQTGRTRVAFERGSKVRFEPDTPSTVEALSAAFSTPFQHLLTFAIGVPTYLVQMDVTADGIGQQLGERWFPRAIHVGHQGWHSPTGERSPVQMRFTLAQITDRFEEVVRNWDGLHKKHEQSMLLLFALSLGLDLYLDSQFLFAVQALELYHRKEWPEGVLPPAEHEARIKAIVDLVTEPDPKKWLKEKLAYSNEPTLYERLEKLLAFAGPEVLVALRPDFAKVAKDTRNYLTHYNERLRARAAQDEDLWVLGNECAGLLEFCILRALGFDGQTSLQMSANTPRFQSLLYRRGALSSPIQVSVSQGPGTDPGEQADEVRDERDDAQVVSENDDENGDS